MTDPEEISDLFLRWAVSQGSTGPRGFIRTQRIIRQTGPQTAAFVRGEVEFVVADGAIGGIWRDQIIPFFEEWDTDQDGWRDVVEQEYQNQVGLTPAGTNWAEDPFYNPPRDQFPPDVFWTVLANGSRLPVRPEGSAPASVVLPFAGNSVILASGPFSPLPKPQVLFNYSTSFFVTTQAGSGFLNGLSVYHWSKEYTGNQGGAIMEREILPSDAYRLQFPVTTNPAQTAVVGLNHLPVPNGALTLGQRRADWLIRKVETFVGTGQQFTEQRWENGRLVIDPVLVNYFTMDNLVGLFANPLNDRLAISVLDDAGDVIWPPLSGSGFVLNLQQPTFPLVFGQLYGTPGLGGNPTSVLEKNGEISFFYQRNVSTPPSGGDVSSVELRVPVKFRQSYQSWRQLFFGANAFNDFISGKNADPDNDGIVNIDEFEGGTNPNVIDLGPIFITFVPPATAPGAGALLADGDEGPEIRYDKPGGTESQSNRTIEYSFETSINATDWDPIDETNWHVDENAVRMIATYFGSDPLPPTMLFRVRYVVPEP